MLHVQALQIVLDKLLPGWTGVVVVLLWCSVLGDRWETSTHSLVRVVKAATSLGSKHRPQASKTLHLKTTSSWSASIDKRCLAYCVALTCCCIGVVVGQ
jgi:hypothetical protein